MDSKKLLIRLVLIIFFIFLLNYLAMRFYWYSSVWYLDMLMHFLGGIWLGFLSLYLFPLKDISFKSIFKIFLLVFFVGISWEIFEILIDRVITGNFFDTLDTISDICFDIAGGFFAVLYFIKRIKPML